MRRPSAWGVTLAVLAVAAAAQAYILPGGSILRRMADGRDDLKLAGLKVDGNLSFYREAAKEAGAALGLATLRPELQIDAAVFLRLPGNCRMEVSSVESGKSSASIEARGKRRIEGVEIPALSLTLAQLCPLLGSRSPGENESRATIERHLSRLKIEYRKSALARFGGQVVYVLGDPAEGSPQLWIYKDSFLPARLRFTDGSGTGWDVRLLDYSSPATGEWFPRSVELWKGSAPWLKFTGLTADAKPKFEDRLF
jgi:hypothetical protein